MKNWCAPLSPPRSLYPRVLERPVSCLGPVKAPPPNGLVSVTLRVTLISVTSSFEDQELSHDSLAVIQCSRAGDTTPSCGRFLCRAF